MARVTHFEIQADDPARAAHFYASAFGWRIEQVPGYQYWLLYTGWAPEAGIDGAIMPRQGPAPAADTPIASFICTVEVEDIDAVMASIRASGGQITVEKIKVPNVGWRCFCRDTEGNSFGLHQFDEAASAEAKAEKGEQAAA